MLVKSQRPPLQKILLGVLLFVERYSCLPLAVIVAFVVEVSKIFFSFDGFVFYSHVFFSLQFVSELKFHDMGFWFIGFLLNWV